MSDGTTPETGFILQIADPAGHVTNDGHMILEWSRDQSLAVILLLRSPGGQVIDTPLWSRDPSPEMVT
ncbi:hypothetical protein E2C01_101542 [Portunus trituberculatus]|uniref:Uncharacterized protein n=1 Tax=Portunus trituberculatus TaxID=210409 RepID=A0A5B7KGB2_PORTR|nr:hypothetical protein [Portunus trituberculatus]